VLRNGLAGNPIVIGEGGPAYTREQYPDLQSFPAKNCPLSRFGRQPTPHENPKGRNSCRWIMVRHSIFAIGILGMLTGCAAVVQDVPAPRGSYFEREPEPATIKGAI